MNFIFDSFNLEDFDLYSLLIQKAENISKKEFIKEIGEKTYKKFLKENSLNDEFSSYWKSKNENGEVYCYININEIEYFFQ